MNCRIINLHRGFRAAVPDVLFRHLMRIKARIVDGVMVDGCAAVGHPVGDEFAHAGTVLDPDGDGIPQAAHLLAFAHGWTAIGRDLQEAVEGVAFIIAEFAQNGRQFDCPLQRFQNLVHFEVALRWRETRFVLFQKVTRMAQARVLFFVIAPFDLSAFSGFGSPVSRI